MIGLGIRTMLYLVCGLRVLASGRFGLPTHTGLFIALNSQVALAPGLVLPGWQLAVRKFYSLSLTPCPPRLKIRTAMLYRFPSLVALLLFQSRIPRDELLCRFKPAVHHTILKPTQ